MKQPKGLGRLFYKGILKEVTVFSLYADLCVFD